jgi:hypothetical protein
MCDKRIKLKFYSIISDSPYVNSIGVGTLFLQGHNNKKSEVAIPGNLQAAFTGLFKIFSYGIQLVRFRLDITNHLLVVV